MEFALTEGKMYLLGSIPHQDCAHCTPKELVAISESRLHWDRRNACYLATFVAGPAQSVIINLPISFRGVENGKKK